MESIIGDYIGTTHSLLRTRRDLSGPGTTALQETAVRV